MQFWNNVGVVVTLCPECDRGHVGCIAFKKWVDPPKEAKEALLLWATEDVLPTAQWDKTNDLFCSVSEDTKLIIPWHVEGIVQAAVETSKEIAGVTTRSKSAAAWEPAQA